MALSYITYSGGAVDGIITNFSVPMKYLEQAHVLVYLDGVLKALTTDYTWFNSTTISFNTAPTSGTVVHFRRTTPSDERLVDFQDAGNLTEFDLDTSDDQNFYLSQEAQDDFADFAMSLAPDDKWDSENKVLKNVADGVDPTDGVNLLQVTSITSGDAAAAAASAAAALVSEGLADADATATAADVATTNADVISTNADAVSTAADAVNTALDALATAADAVATAADAVSTAADAAATASDATDTGIDAAATAADVITTAGSVVSAANSAAAAAADLVLTNADVVSCAASYDSFDDRYLGAKATAPTLDNDGDALLTGALYYNTTDNLMKVYDGAAWLTVGAAEIAALAPTKGRLIVGNGTSWVDLGVGADGEVILADAAEAKGVKWGAGGVSHYKTAAQDWTGNMTVAFTHSLGGVPDIVTGYLVCTTADDGYSIGDIHEFTFAWIYSVGEYGHKCWASSTEIGAYLDTTMQINNKSTGAQVNADKANWDFYLTAIKY